MEMTEYGKHGKPRGRLSTLPTLLGNPFGITTFPRPRLLAYFKVQEHERTIPRPLDLKGVVMEVLGQSVTNVQVHSPAPSAFPTLRKEREGWGTRALVVGNRRKEVTRKEVTDRTISYEL
jgi:hypothetical protein